MSGGVEVLNTHSFSSVLGGFACVVPAYGQGRGLGHDLLLPSTSQPRRPQDIHPSTALLWDRAAPAPLASLLHAARTWPTEIIESQNH